MFTRQFAVGLANILRGRLARHPESVVIIVLGSGGHRLGVGVRDQGSGNRVNVNFGVLPDSDP